MKDLLHVVVGAGLPEYFFNCLRSITELSRHDVLAFYNYVDQQDLEDGLGVAANFPGSNIVFEFQENVAGPRTGSLYDAYNAALEHANGKYRYVSLVQSDMQLMWWSEEIISACDGILNEASGHRELKTCFYTQIPVRGKRLDYYSIWPNSNPHTTPTIPGIVDVGIYPLEEFNPASFRFEQSEREMALRAATRDYVVALHPYPFLAPIPFPTTLRDRQRNKQPKGPQGQPKPILVVSPNFQSYPDFSKRTFHPIYMEDSVWPNGWSALSPYWPSDTVGNQWMKVRLSQGREPGVSPLGIRGARHSTWLALMGSFKPGYVALVRALAAVMIEGLRGRMKRR